MVVEKDICYQYFHEQSDVFCHIPCLVDNCTAVPTGSSECVVWTCVQTKPFPPPPQPPQPSNVNNYIYSSVGGACLILILIVLAVLKVKKLCCFKIRIPAPTDRLELLDDESSELQVLHPSIIRGQARTSVINIQLNSHEAINISDTPQSPSSPDDVCLIDCVHLNCRFVRDQRNAQIEKEKAERRTAKRSSSCFIKKCFVI